MSVNVAFVDDARSHARAYSLAHELGLPLVDRAELERGQFDLFLQMDERGLALREVTQGRGGGILVDFARGAAGYRVRTARMGRQPLARAAGLHGEPLSVADATAGLGTDALMFARLGCSVLAIERSPVIAALLRDGLERAANATCSDLQAAARRVKLLVADARVVLEGISDDDAPDVVYLDPMYPSRRKSALGKKAMRICRLAVGPDTDVCRLLDTARRVARRRVVVKRQRLAPPLAPGRSTHYLRRTVRFDVYAPAQLARGTIAP
ncbi:MAG: class I SAM-dependent methyltransferase [Phycisphaerae bacterium]